MSDLLGYSLVAALSWYVFDRVHAQYGTAGIIILLAIMIGAYLIAERRSPTPPHPEG